MKIDTLAIHGGHKKNDELITDITPPIHMSTTYRREADGSYKGHVYSRTGNPNRDMLESRLAALEQGDIGFAFASGLAAVHAILQALPKPMHMVLPDDLYHGTRCLIEQVSELMQINTSVIDFTDEQKVEQHLQQFSQTGLGHQLVVWLENPTNPRLKLLNIKSLSTLVHQYNGLVVCDNTVATPILCKPLLLGADIVMHSTTKYIGGHSDLIGGIVVINNNNPLGQNLRDIQHLTGAIPSPFDCWLLLRSLATLPCRMKQHCINAKKVAEFLSQHNKVEIVHYPELPEHPQFSLAKKQMPLGCSGLLSFQVRNALELTRYLKIIQPATSLGGVESLIEHRASIAGESPSIPDTLLRVSIGLEHIDDLLEDFAQALDRI